MVARCTVRRKGRPTPSCAVFSWKDAKQAALAGKDTYKQYPGRMLKARARAFALRDAFPDVLCGVYSSDEAADMPPTEATVATFPDGSEQPTTDLEQLIEADGEIVDDSVDLADMPLVEWPDAKGDLFDKTPAANEA
jgi:hypothetical protein